MRRFFTLIPLVCAFFFASVASETLAAGPEDRGNVSILPVGAAPKALDAPHFPNRLCAFVWRNWNLLELDASARMNVPGVPEGCWGWRFGWEQLTDRQTDFLRDITSMYHR